jgi:hypothetical protein
MLYKGEINYQGQCFTLYTRWKGDPLKNFCYQIAKKLYSGSSSKDLWIAAMGIKGHLEDGFDRYHITEVKDAD